MTDNLPSSDEQRLADDINKLKRRDNMLLYTDTVQGEQTLRDDLWSISSEELDAIIQAAQQYARQREVALLDKVAEEANQHIQRLEYKEDGITLDLLAITGHPNADKGKRDALVTERRAMLVIYGIVDKLKAQQQATDHNPGGTSDDK